MKVSILKISEVYLVKYISVIVLATSILFVSLPFLVYAQDTTNTDSTTMTITTDSPTDTKTTDGTTDSTVTKTEDSTTDSDSTTRTTDSTTDTKTTDSTTETDTTTVTSTVDNTETDTTVTKTETDTTTDSTTRTRLERFERLSDAYSDLDRETERVRRTLSDEVDEGINESIDQIINEAPAVSPIKLRVQTNELHTRVQEEIDRTLLRERMTDTERVGRLNTSVNDSLSRIEAVLRAESGVEVSLDRSVERIRDTLESYREKVAKKKEVIDQREGDLIFRDSDGDGLSDYDEKNIFGTDPNNEFTVPGTLSDGEKILRGIDPTSKEARGMSYEDPREAREVVVSKVHSVTEVEKVKENGRVKLAGKALPNSYVTLYIFSTPIVVTVKTNDAGEWTHTLEQELENGDHQVYVTTVNNSGKIIARSNPIGFTQTAEAATISIVDNDVFSTDTPTDALSFIENNQLIFLITILLAAIVISLILIGRHSNRVRLAGEVPTIDATDPNKDLENVAQAEEKEDGNRE